MLYFLTGLFALKAKFSHTKDTTKSSLFCSRQTGHYCSEDLVLTFAHRQWSKQDFRCTSMDICNYLHGKKNRKKFPICCYLSCLVFAETAGTLVYAADEYRAILITAAG